MIRGHVSRDLEPLVTIEIEASDGSFQPHEIVLDTAFSGELALPYRIIERLGLTYRGQSDWTLATGREEQMHDFAGVIFWHGQRREVAVLETQSESLLGASLLSGSRISIDFRRGGEVVVEEEDWPTQ